MYDLIVLEENLLIKINYLIDFSCIYDELLNKYYSKNGRMAESPFRIFKYLLLLTIYTVSDVDVVERSRYDIFFNMNPEDDVKQYANATSIGYFFSELKKNTQVKVENYLPILNVKNEPVYAKK